MAKKGKGARKSGGKAKKGRKPASRARKSSKAKKPTARKATRAKSKPKKSMRAASARKSTRRAKKSASKAAANKPKKASSSRKPGRGGQATVRITESVTKFIATPQGVVADTIETVNTFPPDAQEGRVQTTDDIAAEGQRPSLSSEEEMEEEDEFGEMGEGGASISDMEEPMPNDNGTE